jgi:acyl phosphate:glycerol-3-phosphate acyltransferase
MVCALAIIAASYLLGSIPFGYLLVRIFRGEDVRQSGSGNIGATNVSRKSPALGILTLLLDACKGSAAVALGIALSPALFERMPLTHIPWREILPASSSPALAPWATLAALFAILGHMFPVWLKFRGGKGVATGLGAFAMIAPLAVLCSAVVFIVVVFLFRYISLGSIIAVALFPTFTWTLREFGSQWQALAFISLSSLAIVLKHHQNIQRLLTGKENRIGSKTN